MAITWVPTVEERFISDGKMYVRVRLATSASNNTYTTGGDAVPSFGDMGFKRNMDLLEIYDSSAGGFVYKFDRTNGKIKIFQGDNTNAAAAPLIELPAATAHNSVTLYAKAQGW